MMLNSGKAHIGELGDILLAQGFQLDLLHWWLWDSIIRSFSPAERKHKKGVDMN